MATTGTRIDDVEQGLLDAVSSERLMVDTRAIAQWVRLSGSEEEKQAFDYIEQRCREAGARVARYAPECFVSLPGPATLTIVAPEAGAVECITHAFGQPTDGLEGEVVYGGHGTPAELTGKDVRGKIVLSEGLSSPGKVRAATQAGAAAVISINDENFHEMIVTPVWGTPVPETAGMVPALPILSVKEPDGKRLKELAERGGLRVRITAQVVTGWRPLPCLTAELPGDDPEGHFVMFSGHVDSWHYGAMDNGSANATMLEVLRVLAQRPGGMRRGLRLAFWSGHSHARYATSTWYADTFWRELHDRCVAHVNVDSTGGVGANVLDEAETMAETTGLAAAAIEAVSGQKLSYRRFGRAGDQSFWGPGLPSVFMSLSQQGEVQSGSVANLAAVLGTNPGRSGGLGWWWHTIHDTIDKIDPQNLTRDTKIYVLVCNRLCTAPVLPLDYHATATEIRDAIREYADAAKGAVDLTPSLEAAEAVVSETSRLNEAIRTAGTDARVNEAVARRINAALMAVGRRLVPINYSEVGRYSHDLALPLPTVPVLKGAKAINTLDPSSDAHKFLRTKLQRAQNQVVHELDAARRELRSTLEVLTSPQDARGGNAR